MGVHPFLGTLSQQELNPIKLPYMTNWLVPLTASAFNQLGQYTSTPGHRAYCYTELAII